MSTLITRTMGVFVFSALVMAYIAAAPQEKPKWREYKYPADGFAINLPREPRSHAEASIPNMWIYSVDLEQGSLLSIHVSRAERDCDATLAQLKDGARNGKSGIDPKSVREPVFNGYPGLEYLFSYGPDSERQNFERYYCVDGTFYAFAAAWDKDKPRPASLAKILDSFRLLKR